ncbi:phage tail assembly protein [bacterium D16-50]|nr:phage tail assembly protein [bacterium D16-50]
MDERHEIVEDRESAAGMEAAEDGGDEKLVIALKKPYLFEGKEYTEIDLTGMDDMTAADMIALENQYDKRHPGINVMPEVRVEYAVMMAARAAKLPVEFFNGLPQREAVKVKNRVMGFLFGSD